MKHENVSLVQGWSDLVRGKIENDYAVNILGRLSVLYTTTVCFTILDLLCLFVIVIFLLGR